MIPETSEITVEDSVLRWTNTEFMVSTEEAQALVEKVRQKSERRSVHGVLVDNREADGAWPAEVTDLWGELMGELYEEGIDCATVSPSATNALQINQLAEENGTHDQIKAFTDYQEALEFLGADR